MKLVRYGVREQVLPSAHSRKSSMICSEGNGSYFSVHADNCHLIRYEQYLLPAASGYRVLSFVVPGTKSPAPAMPVLLKLRDK